LFQRKQSDNSRVDIRGTNLHVSVEAGAMQLDTALRHHVAG
jgi:hypothetical protein